MLKVDIKMFTAITSRLSKGHISKLGLCLIVVLFLAGCVSSPYVKDTQPIDRAKLNASDVTVSIPNLSSCTDSLDKSIEIDTTSPLTVLVHGCNGSAGRFRSLAQLYAFHGQQAFCFNYDDRDSLEDTAQKLAVAVEELAKVTKNQNITIAGHSMGGLVARKAVEKDDHGSNILSDQNLELITISAPFSGIRAAKHCGIKPLHWLSLGVLPGLCWIITGDNWYEITSSSDFINDPKPLIPSVKSYLKIVTNEENTCRRFNKSGNCIESDFVFNVAEQNQPIFDDYANMTRVQVDAGHVEIVGYKDVEPRKLLSILQDQGMISKTPPERKAELERLFADLY